MTTPVEGKPAEPANRYEPWPLGTEARFRFLCWPDYALDDDLEPLFKEFGALFVGRKDVCLCLRHDAAADLPLDDALKRVQEVSARVLGESAEFEVLVVTEAMGLEDLPRLGNAVTAVLELPSTLNPGPRSDFVQSLLCTLVMNAAQARSIMDASVRAPGPVIPRRHVETFDDVRARRAARRAAAQYWLDRGYEDCVPYLPPFRLDIALTAACNARCVYCWQDKKDRGKLTFDAVASVLDAMCVSHPPSILLTGGEPTIWPDFERFVAYARQRGVDDLTVCTNGSRLCDYDFARRIVQSGVTAINVSVDTLKPELFEKIRNYPFSRFQKAIENLLRLRQEFPHLIITLASVISKAITPEDLDEVHKFARQHHFCRFVQGFDMTPNAEINARYALTAEETKAFRARLDWLGGKVGEVVRRDKNPFTEAATARCYKGVSTVKLCWNGAVLVCWAAKEIGNILHQPFIDVWLGEEARQRREFIRDRKCKCNFDCDIFESLDLVNRLANR